eukprot:10668026-Heterocapsa_arctica.AAC.1
MAAWPVFDASTRLHAQKGAEPDLLRRLVRLPTPAISPEWPGPETDSNRQGRSPCRRTSCARIWSLILE